MEIMLINANFMTSPRPAAPIGLAFISAALKNYGCNVSVLDLCWSSKYHIEVINALKSFKGNIICISFRNLDNCTFLEPVSFAPYLKRIIQCCRKYSSAKIVVGGAGFSIAPERLMRYTAPDYGIVGEGENSIIQLVRHIENNASDLSLIPGFLYFKEGELISNPLQSNINLNNNYIPDRKIYDERYFEEILAPSTDTLNKTYPAYETIQSKRGCDLNCAYCSIKKVQGSCVRLKDPILVVEEIKNVLMSNPLISEIEFVDATFNCPNDHAIKICEAIINSGLKFKWNCELSPRLITKEFAELLERSGCTRVEFGTDVLSDAGLEKMQKGYDFAQILKVDEIFSKTSIMFAHCIFLGALGETEYFTRQSLERWKLLKSHQVYATFGIRAYENTSVYNEGIKNGVINLNNNPMHPTFYVEPDILTNDKLLDSIENHVNSCSKWYVWWGLKNISLKQRITEASQMLADIKNQMEADSVN